MQCNVHTLHLVVTCLFVSGLLRGIDPNQKMLYVTTPEVALERVNVLVMGKSDQPDFISKQVQMLEVILAS